MASGSLVNKFGNYADSDSLCALTIHYSLLNFLQTQFDLFRLRTLLEANPKIVGAIGNTPTVTPIYILGGVSAGVIGSNLIGNEFPAERFVLNNPGGDLVDIVINGAFGPGLLLEQIEGY